MSGYEIQMRWCHRNDKNIKHFIDSIWICTSKVHSKIEQKHPGNIWISFRIGVVLVWSIEVLRKFMEQMITFSQVSCCKEISLCPWYRQRYKIKESRKYATFYDLLIITFGSWIITVGLNKKMMLDDNISIVSVP